MAEVVWTEPALTDVDDIAEYIALTNPAAARELVQTIFEKVERLETFTLSGKEIEELSSFNYREVVAPACRIFYKVEAERVLILHVMRQERQLRAYMLS